MRRLRPALVIVAVVMVSAACAADDTGSDVAAPAGVTSAGDEEPNGDEHTGHDDHDDDPAGGSGSAALDGGTGTTEAAIQRMLDADPSVLARAHDHGNDHDGHATRDHPNGIDPHRIVIPAISVDADVIDLGLQDDGTMEVPTDFAQTGWFDRGPKPGRVGPAVIAGHVDDRSGPAVFYDLAELEPGDEIEVHSEDGEVVVFAVRETQQHPKDAFPTEAVYAGTPGPELRLITCSGEFDGAEGSYRDNTIVFAERVDA